MREPFLALDAQTLDAPMVQPLNLFLDLLGESLRERLFLVQSEGAADACLRPDFTLAAVLSHIESAAPFGRYVYEGPAFRVAPAGSQRAEQFLQIGLECFGAGSTPESDATMAALAWRSARAGGRNDLTLHLGDVGLFGAFLDAVGVAPPLAKRLTRAFSDPRRLRRDLAEAARERQGAPDAGRARLTDILSHLPEADACGVLEEIWTLAGIEPVGGRTAAEIAHRLVGRAHLEAAPRLSAEQSAMIERFLAIAERPSRALAQVSSLAPAAGRPLSEALRAWELRLKALEAHGVPEACMTLSAAFGRAFGYYDGVLFEIRSAALSDDQPVAAGGRYDALPARLGGAEVRGAVGCMVRPGRAWREGLP
jgi:ATP phosphoribosyltransferase regulatory subunit